MPITKQEDFGSVNNLMLSRNKSQPEIGKGATVLSWTDRYEYEVMNISPNGKRVTLRKYDTKCEPFDGYTKSRELPEVDIHDKYIVLKKNVWYWEVPTVEYINYSTLTKEQRNSCWNEHGVLMVVEGFTKVKTKYNKVDIVFGILDGYYDPHF